MDEGTQSGEQHHRRRRRRSSSSKTKPGDDGILQAIRSKAFGRVLFSAMCLLGAVLVLQSWREVHAARGRLGTIELGMNRAQVSQALGQPTTISGRDWNFQGAGKSTIVTFAQDSDKVAGISCSEQDRTSAACPDLLGVRVGGTESDVRRLLGAGQRSGTPAQNRIEFERIGASFDLDDGRVSAVALKEAERDGAVWPIVLWRLLP